MKINLGEIYKTNWDGNVGRIIGYDDYEVFYDGYLKHDDSWTFASNSKKKCYFYRTAVDVFLEQSDKIDFKELSEPERSLFRPDLVIRTCRIKNLSWTDDQLSDKLQLEGFLNKIASKFPIIQSDKIWLYPFGPKGGLKKGELIEANNKKAFTTFELMEHAARLQKAINPNPTDGIGLYRAGIQKQIPSYYIGPYYDFAGLMERKERLGI